MSFKLTESDNLLFISINCPLDEQKEARFKEITEKALESDPAGFVFDFKNCDYINSCSIGIIFSFIRQNQGTEKKIMLLNVCENLDKWFREIKLDTVVRFCKSRKECFDILNK